MTNEQAIEILEYYRADANSEEGMSMFGEALDLAIKALKQQPCEDCISREEVMKFLEKEDWADTVYGVLALPSVTPKTEWIPCSERLPEDSELVLFSTKTDEVFEGRYFDDNTNHQWYSFRDDTFAWNNVVIAWMPLPQPYKAESEE